MFLSFLLKTEFSLLVKQPGVLSIKNTFESGQIFGWKKFVSSHNSVSQIFYLGTLNNHALAFRQNQGDHRVYTACWDSFGKKVQIGEKKRKEIQDYFNIDFSVSREYETKWKNSLNFNKLYEKFEGLRIINQDIVDCLFSFVCSTNNNIPRIQRMVNDLKQYYGEPIFLEGTKLCLKKFPTVYRMAHLDETDQVRLNLGYRFKYLKAIASFLIKNEEKLTNTKIDQNYNDFTFLNNIKELSYDKAFRELKKLHGVGNKIADCVLLFSMKKFMAVPIDTHMLTVSREKLNIPRFKSLTDKRYLEVSNIFRAYFGDYAGWAHCYLFSEDIKKGTRKSIKKKNKF